ncbi:diguanylate cyclase [Amylibacter marinus]|uniref:dihydroneopterin aldolase n=1 Tax=Amylibacter marinus TaxID=1475483 RepID=A0ABQ5VT06_9RHOB|nr:dihydroneopterin aldolase [Amylibacter marinus]GLQ34572.1 diguanylate cyclase [Amylibacter marinus]
MTKDTAFAFETLETRASATARDPHDRIAVRDYTVNVEIGAFQAERGVTQGIRFNVVLEVANTAAAKFDDVDQVLSYDTITEAIDHQLEVERLNLLETLAERIAAQILTNPKAIRVFVRIEKLDRIPGTLGVEIVRSRIDADNLVKLDETVGEEAPVHPRVFFLPNALIQSSALKTWLNAIETHCLPAVLCLETTQTPIPQADITPANRRINLLSIEQNAWVLAGKDSRCVVVDSRTELDWAMKRDQLSVWAPSKMVLDATDKPSPDASPLDLAGWFAEQFAADQVYILGSGPFRENMQVLAQPEMLA